mmetsp:Transcript_10480/g.22204  ORF Transcript_10480/g.22204 Transcript_10480/m.22204 type:complete len:183 (-) Transcript_10480:242-790(-)
MRFTTASFIGILLVAAASAVSAAKHNPVPGSCRITTPGTAAAAAASAFPAKPAFAPTAASAASAARETITSLRGGAVLEPATLSDVDGIVLKASAEGKLVIIDFSATWCGPCKMIAPLFKELSDANPNAVFLKVDVDENPDTAAKYSVSAMPTFIFIKKGEVVDRLMGANPDVLRDMCNKLA